MSTPEIDVRVEPRYLPEESDPLQETYGFAYTITIANSGDAPAQLISRHWIFPNPFAPNESEESIADKKRAFKEAGMAYTIRLIDEYRVSGIAGIHLYALNKYDDVAALVKESGIKDL